MGWLGWSIILIIGISVTFTFALCKVASRADDLLLGDKQYEAD